MELGKEVMTCLILYSHRQIQELGPRICSVVGSVKLSRVGKFRSWNPDFQCCGLQCETIGVGTWPPIAISLRMSWPCDLFGPLSVQSALLSVLDKVAVRSANLKVSRLRDLLSVCSQIQLFFSATSLSEARRHFAICIGARSEGRPVQMYPALVVLCPRIRKFCRYPFYLTLLKLFLPKASVTCRR